ncbi:MAG TPA: hypothetical protein VGN37_16720 [Actinocatenispora sp.]
MTVSTLGRSRVILRTAVPAAAGILAALAIGAASGVAPVIMVCGAIYLFAATIARRWGSWLGFALSFAVLAPGMVLANPWISFGALGAIQLALVIVGLARGTWRVPINRLQLLGAVAFSVVALAAGAGNGLWAGLVAVAGLLGHGGWDLWHHRADAVVMRSYAAFCAALDIALAAVVTVALVVAG